MLDDIIPPEINKELEDAAIIKNTSQNNIIGEEALNTINSKDKSVTITNETVLDIDVLNNYKDALLASLYSQMEFLKNEIEEKNLLIRKLIINDQHSSAHSKNDIPEKDTTSEYDGDNDVDNVNSISVLTQSEIEIELQQRLNIENQLTDV